MSAPKYHGLELPLYDFETVTFARGRDLARVCAQELQQGAETIVRGVDAYNSTPARNLAHLLTTVDDELVRLAEIGCETGSFAMIEDYQWGLTQLPADEMLQKRHSHPLVPDGLALVAEVPLVPHYRPTPRYDQQTAIVQATSQYRQSKQPGDWVLDNVNVWQFIPRHTDNMPVYVDIDPYAVIV